MDLIWMGFKTIIYAVYYQPFNFVLLLRMLILSLMLTKTSS